MFQNTYRNQSTLLDDRFFMHLWEICAEVHKMHITREDMYIKYPQYSIRYNI